jgi:hypothetical protein
MNNNSIDKAFIHKYAQEMTYNRVKYIKITLTK